MVDDGRNLPAVPPPASGAVSRYVAPVLAGHSLTPLNLWRYSRQIQQHLVQAAYTFEVEMIDLEASTQIARAQLLAELQLFYEGMQLAGGNTAAQHLVAMKLAGFAESNRMRLMWRYR